MVSLKIKKDNILFIAYHYPPAGGTSIPGVQRVIKFIRHLDGCKISVLSVRPENYPEFFSLDNNTSLPIKDEKLYRTGTLNIFEFLLKLRSRITRNGGNKKEDISRCNNIQRYMQVNIRERSPDKHFQSIKDIVSSLINFPDFASPWLIPAILTGIKVIKEDKINIIFATGMPWTSLLIGLFLKLITGKKLIIDFRDPWVNNPFFNKNKLERYLEKKSESFLIKKADIISANTEMLKRELIARYPRNRKSIICLPNGYDECDFLNIPIVAQSKGKLIITHAGFLYGKRDPYILVEAIQILYKTYPKEASRIEFHQIGNINLTYDFEKVCLEKGLKNNFRFLKQMDYKRCLGYLGSSDVLLIIQPGTKTQIPSKLYEYIYIGKPIVAVAEADGALGQLVATYGFGKVFEPNMVEEIADYLLYLTEMKMKGHQLTVNYENRARFNIKEITRQLQEKIDQV